MLPIKYGFLGTIGTLPKMITEGIKLLGIKEIKGSNDSPEIMAMAKELGIASIYDHDEIAWCSMAMSLIATRAGKPMPFKSYDILRALKWAEWGNPIAEPQLGDVLVFKRDGGGHVGMYIAESGSTYFVMGGNQGDSYSITEIAKNRLYTARRFYATAPPASVKKYIIDSSGNISTNEA
jgi:uncharacterized protein (TIGR02594 family)